MKILQLASYYTATTVFKNLFSEITPYKDQIVFVPIRNKSEYGKNSKERLRINYCQCLNLTDRFFFKKKIQKVQKTLEHEINLSEVKIIHAHTLFSDGAVAFKIFKKRRIPYVITVRNTDLNIFFKYLWWLRPLGRKIIASSEMVIFANHTYDKKLLNLMKGKSFNYSIIPNGLDEFWINNKGTCKDIVNEKHLNFLYVGNFDKNKNIAQAINYLEKLKLNNKDLRVKLMIVGGGKSGRNGDHKNQNLDHKVNQLKSNIIKVDYLGKINNKEALLKVYRNTDFYIMLSKKETFGLTYLEAMSQGVPIIYTEGEGISSFFEDYKVGFGVNIKDELTIDSKIETVINNYRSISENCIQVINDFKWSIVAKNHIHIYSKIESK